MEHERLKSARRGSGFRPQNRFEKSTRVLALDVVDLDPEDVEGWRNPATEFIPDASRSVITENDSPDVGFSYSLNPYRGCEHGCSYCYARPTHEYLGYDAGLGFETKIVVKHEAPRLFREFLARDSWIPQPIAISGVTDPYQPCERQFRITRRCLEVAAAAGQPVGLITKSCAGPSRPRNSGADGLPEPRPREYQRDHARRETRAVDGTANVLTGRPVARDPRTRRCRRAGPRSDRAGDSGHQRCGDSGDPLGREGRGSTIRWLHYPSPSTVSRTGLHGMARADARRVKGARRGAHSGRERMASSTIRGLGLE